MFGHADVSQRWLRKTSCFITAQSPYLKQYWLTPYEKNPPVILSDNILFISSRILFVSIAILRVS